MHAIPSIGFLIDPEIVNKFCWRFVHPPTMPLLQKKIFITNRLHFDTLTANSISTKHIHTACMLDERNTNSILLFINTTHFGMQPILLAIYFGLLLLLLILIFTFRILNCRYESITCKPHKIDEIFIATFCSTNTFALRFALHLHLNSIFAINNAIK